MLLAIDTCGALGGVALGDPLLRSESSASWLRELAGKTYSELLLTEIEDLLREAGVTLQQLTGVVVVRGPGSFTGIRIGVSAAKGLAEGLEIPVIAVSRLELLSRQGPESGAIALLDAGRNEFYAGFYRKGLCETEALLTRDALAQSVASSRFPVLVCEQQLFSALEDMRPMLVSTPTAVEALALGTARFRSGLFDDNSMFEANYLRRSENEMLARIAEHTALLARVPAISE